MSVRSADESLDAARGGADIIDIKEPQHGSLGAASVDVLADICQTLRQTGFSGPISAALGELGEVPKSVPFPPQLAWVKAGLSGSPGTNWKTDWRRLQEQVHQQNRPTQLITVVYADWQNCAAPSPDEVVELAISANAPGVLFDTFHKGGQHLLEYLPPSELRPMIDALHAAGLFAALAGSIGLDQLLELMALQPDIIAVRSAVCVGGRTGRVDAARVAAFRAAFVRSMPAVCDGESVSTKHR